MRFQFHIDQGTNGPRNDFIVGVGKRGQLLPKIYKYAYTKIAPIEVFEGASASGGRGGPGGQPPLPCPHFLGLWVPRSVTWEFIPSEAVNLALCTHSQPNSAWIASLSINQRF